MITAIRSSRASWSPTSSTAAERSDQAGWIASTDGWDDMGDMTSPQYAACSGCGGVVANIPDNLDWG